ncbi:MAG: energy-coupled thiamine transporter ThiT [Clostridiales bacterium]|jgi:thiamine transporter|nr:energy-coupled thiamine transporter ThiT [Clostridiales bacterium]
MFQSLLAVTTAVSVVISVAVSVVCIALVAVLSYRHKAMTTKEIALAAVCVGVSFALSYIKFSLPQGGSATAASLVPVCIFAYIYGFRKGLIVGIVYGWLQLVQEPYILHPAQVLLDYVLGFGCIAFAGAFRKRNLPKAGMYDLLLGVAVAGLGRYFCSFLSGVVFYAEYAWEGWPVWAYSLAYNGILMIDIAICLAVCAVLQYTPQFKKAVLYMNPEKAASPAPQDAPPADIQS